AAGPSPSAGATTGGFGRRMSCCRHRAAVVPVRNSWGATAASRPQVAIRQAKPALREMEGMGEGSPFGWPGVGDFQGLALPTSHGDGAGPPRVVIVRPGTARDRPKSYQNGDHPTGAPGAVGGDARPVASAPGPG